MKLEKFRTHFPSLRREIHGRPIVYLDGPAGTQVPNQVMDSMSSYYKYSNANTHGYFAASQETDRLLEAVRGKVAAFLGAESPSCISFGQNMTTLNFSLSKALARSMQPGDEILITQLDHESNRGPWITLEEQGIIVKEVNLLAAGVLDYEDLKNKITSRTKLICIGYASNIFGTVNNIALVRSLTMETGIKLLVDAVHYVPHMSIDVSALECDFLLCSAYKFYGPHVGILYVKPGLLDTLATDRLRTQDPAAPFRIETGTLNHAAIAGVGAAIEFIAQFGRGDDLRTKLIDAMKNLHQHEMKLVTQLYHGIKEIRGSQIYGPKIDSVRRAPTLAFTLQGKTPQQVCYELAKKAIYAWDGHFYAIRATEILGLLEGGGVTRMGVVGYNTEDEISYTLKALHEIG
ncbi:MAG: cysteine desulfurase-like protein [Saprospiraceae bacterium]|nr:cysteine desulfurase-like protein [Saprospiraceae bacterium]